MGQSNQVFQRVEKKFLLSKQQYELLRERMEPYMCADHYGKYTICNVYYDTPDYELIRRSLEKPVYKEKFRIRSYGVITREDKVFLEIKKKYKGTVFKRRVSMTYQTAIDYLDHGTMPRDQSQIMKEIDYFVKQHHIIPKLFLAYDRLAFYSHENEELRVTFDTGIRSREDHLQLDYSDEGHLLMNKDFFLMEIKVRDAIPMWMARILSDLNIFSTSFSKYGAIYSKRIIHEFEGMTTKTTEDKECLEVLLNQGI